jgi:hypothetical protein
MEKMSNNTDRYAIVFSREGAEDTPDNWIVIDTLNSIDSDPFETLDRYVYDAERYLADDNDIGFLRIYDSAADSFVQCDLGDIDIMVVGKEPEND